jgi:hypothetical protein
MTDLDELLAKLKADVAAKHAQADILMREADLVAARIQGVEEARAAMVLAEGDAALRDIDARAERLRNRKPRRDIRALVKATVEKKGLCSAATLEEQATEIAEEIGCRKSQVEAALRAMSVVKPDGESVSLQLGELPREPLPDVVSVEGARRHADLAEG